MQCYITSAPPAGLARHCHTPALFALGPGDHLCHQQTCAGCHQALRSIHACCAVCLENKHASITPRADASSPHSLSMQGLPALHSTCATALGFQTSLATTGLWVTTTLKYCAAKHQQLGGGDTAHMLPHELAATGSPLSCTHPCHETDPNYHNCMHALTLLPPVGVPTSPANKRCRCLPRRCGTCVLRLSPDRCDPLCCSCCGPGSPSLSLIMSGFRF